jgi:hypothetical protein
MIVNLADASRYFPISSYLQVRVCVCVFIPLLVPALLIPALLVLLVSVLKHDGRLSDFDSISEEYISPLLCVSALGTSTSLSLSSTNSLLILSSLCKFELDTEIKTPIWRKKAQKARKTKIKTNIGTRLLCLSSCLLLLLLLLIVVYII